MSFKSQLFPAVAAAALWVMPALADHTKDIAKVLPPAFAGDLGPANSMFMKDAQAPGRNQLLYLYELGALYQVQGEFARSADFFNRADAVAREYEGKAVASVTGGAGQLGAAMTNDTILPWEGACFDKVMSRTLNALNYLAQSKLEGAKVEVRKAEEYQARERDRIQKQVARAGHKDESSLSNPAVSSQYNEMFSFAKDVRNSYENAFTYYLSSHIYRAQGSAGLNDALVDIKQALALAPASPAVQAAYLDLVAQGGDEAALTEAKARLRVGPDWKPADPAQTGTVVVVYEPGLAPRRQEISINLLVGQGQGDLFSMAFPIYRNFGNYQPPLRIQSPAGQVDTTRLLDVRKMAVKALQEQMPAILIRATAGALGKIQAQKKAEQQGGWLGKMAAKVVTAAVTNADLRSWLALPAEVQAAQFTLPAGPNELTLLAYDWSERVKVNLTPGGTTLVVVRSAHGAKTIATTNMKVDL